MPGYPGAGLYKQGTELGELVSLGLSDAGSIPAASTIFPPFSPRPARRPFCRRAGLFFALHTETLTGTVFNLQRTRRLKILNRETRERREKGITTDTQLQRTLRFISRPLPSEPYRSYSGHSIFCSRFSRISRLELQRITTDTPF